MLGPGGCGRDDITSGLEQTARLESLLTVFRSFFFLSFAFTTFRDATPRPIFRLPQLDVAYLGIVFVSSRTSPCPPNGVDAYY